MKKVINTTAFVLVNYRHWFITTAIFLILFFLVGTLSAAGFSQIVK